MFNPRDQHDIENEPHLQFGSFELDPSEAKVDQQTRSLNQRKAEDELAEHSVWSEPTLSPEFGNQTNGPTSAGC